MSYTCYQHGWSDEHLPCPQCQPIVLSSATTDAADMPLPSKGQEGEAERRAWELVDKFNKDKIVCIDYCNKMIDVESSYIETPYGVDQIRFWQQVRNNIVNL